MTIDNLSKIIEKFNLYPEERKVINPSILAEGFRKSTTLELINADVVGNGRNSKATLAFTLSFDHKVGSVAQQVANELVTLFLDENIRSRTQRAEESTKFLEEESEKVKPKSKKLKINLLITNKIGGSLPELLPVNMASISRIEILYNNCKCRKKC